MHVPVRALQAVEIRNVRHRTCAVGGCVLGACGRGEGIDYLVIQSGGFPFACSGMYSVLHSAAQQGLSSLGWNDKEDCQLWDLLIF